MKNIAKVLLLCVLACGCTKDPDPLEEALGAYILQGREGTFRLYKLEKIDSVTFRTEFEHRQNVFDLKLREETRLYEEYSLQRKPKNAARHWDAIQRNHEVMRGLDSLRAGMEARMDEIAYYDYVFSGRAETGDTATEFRDTYFSSTPALEIFTMSAERKDLHKAGGRAIPGYLQMLGETPEE
ncbi:MAG: hypothetical protein GXY24_07855 [Bacteroidales bacterium]|jgi:hypothetical protein|nr:hypothetical protein [Bacteroidales bacterium]